MSQSINYLEGTLSFELASRFLATYIQIEKYNCTYYMDKVGTLDADPTRVASICGLFKFDTLADV
jgi:hypothetical protein